MKCGYRFEVFIFYMKKALAIAGTLALALTPTASFAGHIQPTNAIFRQIRARGNLHHVNLSGMNLQSRNLSSSDLSSANLSGANLSGAILSNNRARNLRGCPSSLPNGWVCENNSLFQQ